eukprot:12900542-Prorocentrum_lima.AAC.1
MRTTICPKHSPQFSSKTSTLHTKFLSRPSLTLTVKVPLELFDHGCCLVQLHLKLTFPALWSIPKPSCSSRGRRR